MRLTRAGEYAVRCVLHLARSGAGRVVGRREIAETMDIPHQFLGKVAQDLARAGIIQITQGASGGYRLVRPPEAITLLDVVEAVEGEIFFNDCLLNPHSCGRVSHCPVHKVWCLAREEFRERLREATFARMAQEEDGQAEAGGSVLPLSLKVGFR